MYLQQWVWHQEHTTGSPPLGLSNCGFTVVDRRVVVYGGYCGHGFCYHNSLYELDIATLSWSELVPIEAEGAPMRKSGCGVVAHSSGGEEQLCVIGGFGELNKPSQQPAAEYVEYTNYPGLGWTNEFHCFISGKHRQYTHHDDAEYVGTMCQHLSHSSCNWSWSHSTIPTAAASSILPGYLLRLFTMCVKMVMWSGAVLPSQP